MSHRLNVLIVDDSEESALQEIEELKKSGYDPIYRRITTKEEMKAALAEKNWEVVISDFYLANFSGLEALNLLKEKGLELPFTIVAASMNEDIALECLKAGIQGFFSKKHIRLLPAAVERGLQEVGLKRQQREAEELFQNLAANSPVGVYIVQESKFVYANARFQEFSGYSKEELIGKKAISLVFPDDRERVRENAIAMLKGERLIPYEFRIINKSGEVKWALESVSSIPYQGKRATLGCYQDITQHKLIEEAVKSNEEKYRSLYQEFQAILDAIPDNLLLITPELKIEWVNRVILTSTGKEASEFIGKHCYQIWHSRSEPCEVCPVQRSFLSQQPDFQEIRNRGKIFEIYSVPIIDETGKVKGVVELARNVTEKKLALEEMMNLQDQLRQAQKMEAIGRLAGGIAHDFNNLLTVIQGHTEISLNTLRKDDPLRPRLEEIAQAANRAANLTRQLLAFSRRQVLNFRTIDLNSLLADLEKMLRRIIGEEIELVTSFAEDLGRIKADPGALEQAIINLVVNAKDAMPQGGWLTIRTANIELTESYARTHPGILPGSYVMVAVTDTGIGMSKEIQAQIFEPFFTTKEVGKGTGLGLSTVYGIIKQCGGDIEVESELGKGTTFKLYLPRVDEPAEIIDKKDRFVAEFPGGNETILVIEDDPAVSKVACQILTQLGYTVLVAESSGDALVICEQEKKPIHLILADVVMPKISGPELIERLAKVRQDFKVLYMSGYVDKKFTKKEKFNFIPKPFTVETLAQKIREVLDNK